MDHVEKIAIYDNVNLLTSELQNQNGHEGQKRFLDTPIPQHDWGSNKWESKVDIIRSDSNRVVLAKPLLLIFLYGAARCCKLLLSSFALDDLIQIREDAGNLLHALVIGCQKQLQPLSTYDAILTDLLNRLSHEEVRRLNACCGHLGLRPVELAVRLDVFWLAERLLCNGVLQKVEITACGPELIIVYDLGEYGPMASDSRYFVSPLILLGEDLSTERLLAIKESNILRQNSIFRAWVTFAIQSNLRYCIPSLFLVILSFFTLICSGFNLTKKRIACTCHHANAEPPTTIDTILEFASLALVSFLLFMTLFGCTIVLVSIVKFYKKIGYIYKVGRLSLTRIFLHYYLPSFVLIINIPIWIYILISPDIVCESTDLHDFIADVFASIYFCIFYMSVHALQNFPSFSQFVANFFDILGKFVPFLSLYILVVIVFARIFENTTFRRRTLNETTDSIDRQLFTNYTQSIYTAFRLSLNIVDLPRASSGDMFMIFHCVYVLILPFMIFNYIIGVVSSKLGTMVEVREERDLVYRGITAAAGVFTSSREIKNAKQRPNEHVLTVCSRITETCFCDKTRDDFIAIKRGERNVDQRY